MTSGCDSTPARWAVPIPCWRTSTQNDFNNLTVVEPQINNLSKSIDLPLPLDAGDTFTYRLNFANNTAHPAQYAPAVRVATTAALSSGTYLPTGGSGGTGAFTSAPAAVDGATLADGDRVLVKNQADAKQNGIYKVVDAANRVWHRASDFDQNAEVTRFYRAFVSSGTANGGKTFLQETASVVLNTSNIVFSEVAANPAVRVATTANIGTGFSANQITGVALTSGNLPIDGVDVGGQ